MAILKSGDPEGVETVVDSAVFVMARHDQCHVDFVFPFVDNLCRF